MAYYIPDPTDKEAVKATLDEFNQHIALLQDPKPAEPETRMENLIWFTDVFIEKTTPGWDGKDLIKAMFEAGLIN